MDQIIVRQTEMDARDLKPSPPRTTLAATNQACRPLAPVASPPAFFCRPAPPPLFCVCDRAGLFAHPSLLPSSFPPPRARPFSAVSGSWTVADSS